VHLQLRISKNGDVGQWESTCLVFETLGFIPSTRKKKKKKPRVLACACNSSTQDAETRSQPGLQSEFKTSLGYTARSCLKNSNRRNSESVMNTEQPSLLGDCHKVKSDLCWSITLSSKGPNTHLHTHTCTNTQCIYTLSHMHSHTRAHTLAHRHSHMHTRMHTPIHSHISIHTYSHTHAYTHAQTHTHTHMHSHTYTYTHTHTHTLTHTH
jgi:hypothetical protein